MGKGSNASKINQARERNLKLAKDKNKQNPNEAAKLVKPFVCKKCFQTFQPTVREPELKQHCDSKHPEMGVSAAFPEFGK